MIQVGLEPNARTQNTLKRFHFVSSLGPVGEGVLKGGGGFDI